MSAPEGPSPAPVAHLHPGRTRTLRGLRGHAAESAQGTVGDCKKAHGSLNKVTACYRQLVMCVGGTSDSTRLREELEESRKKAFELSTGKVKPGVCPPERFTTDKFPSSSCESDDQCLGNQKCCKDSGFKFCKPPAAERPGSCPVKSSKTSTSQRCDDFCTSDSECALGAKCCMGDCGKRCQPSIGEKKGFCPSEIIVNCFRAERSFCDTDTGCTGDLKCCTHGCGSSCQKPVSERNGKCPTDAKNNLQGNVCQSDYDCQRGHKCCGTQSRKRCLQAKQVFVDSA